MKLWKITKFDFGNQLNRRTLVVVLCLLVFCFVIVQLGIGDYKDLKESCETFSKMETLKAEEVIKLISTGLRGRFNFRFKPIPSPLFAISYSAANFKNMFSDFGNDETMSVGRHHDIKDVLRLNIFNLGLLSFLLFIISVAAIVWGFFAFRNTKFTRLLLRFGKLRDVFAGVLLSRMLFVICVLILILLITFFQYMLNGLALAVHEVLLITAVFGVLVLLFCFMFAAGVFFGIPGKKGKSLNGAICAFLFWVTFMIIIPGVFNRVFPDIEAHGVTSMYMTEFEKFKMINDYNNYMYREIKKQKDISGKRQVIEDLFREYLNSYRKSIETINTDRVQAFEKSVDKISFYNALIPVTFYSSLCREVSSAGSNAFIDVYKRNINGIDDLANGYFILKPNVDYLKDQNFVFEQKSSLSSSFLLGLIMSLFYWVVLGLLSYRRLKLSIFPEVEAEKLKAFIEKSKTGKAFEKDETGGFDVAVVTFFSGGVIEEGKENKGDGLYIFDAADMPGDVNTKGLAKLAGLKDISGFENKSFYDVQDDIKEEVVLSILESLEVKVLFLDDIKSIGFYKRVKEIKKDAEVFERVNVNLPYLLKPKAKQ
jgi:hypothetical protein